MTENFIDCSLITESRNFLRESSSDFYIGLDLTLFLLFCFDGE